MGKIGDERAVEALIVALQDKESLVRRAATEALGKVAPKQLVQWFAFMLQDPAREVRMAAAKALSDLNDPSIVDALLNALDEKETEIRLLVIEAMTKFNDPRATQDLIRNLQHPDQQIRQAAAQTLAAFGWQPTTESERFWYALARRAWDEWRPLATRRLDVTVFLLADGDAQTRQAAYEVLRDLGAAVSCHPARARFPEAVPQTGKTGPINKIEVRGEALTSVEGYTPGESGVSLTDANIIVSGGRGISNNPVLTPPAGLDEKAAEIWKAQQGFAMIQELANVLGATAALMMRQYLQSVG